MISPPYSIRKARGRGPTLKMDDSRAGASNLSPLGVGIRAPKFFIQSYAACRSWSMCTSQRPASRRLATPRPIASHSPHAVPTRESLGGGTSRCTHSRTAAALRTSADLRRLTRRWRVHPHELAMPLNTSIAQHPEELRVGGLTDSDAKKRTRRVGPCEFRPCGATASAPARRVFGCHGSTSQVILQERIP
jgi:hypothetical protein